MARTVPNRVTRLPNGVAGFMLHDAAVEKTAAYTVTNGDSGTTFYVKGSSVVFTLPAISNGRIWTFVNAGDDGVAQISISPAAVDGIMYAASATDNKDLINTLATCKKGDYVVIGNLSESITHWQVLDIKGTWAKEA